MFDLILFDLDGTLTDPWEGITKSVQYALSACGIDEPDLSRLTRFIGPPLIPAFEQFYGLSQAQSEFALKKYRERFSTKGIRENRIYSGVPELLNSLKERGKSIALATSKPEQFAVQILETFDIIKYFDNVTGATFDNRISKKADVIEEVFRRLGQPDRSRAVMVGDRSYDILGAKECSIRSVGVLFGYSEPGELEKSGADFIAEDMSSLRSILLQ